MNKGMRDIDRDYRISVILLSIIWGALIVKLIALLVLLYRVVWP